MLPREIWQFWQEDLIHTLLIAYLVRAKVHWEDDIQKYKLPLCLLGNTEYKEIAGIPGSIDFNSLRVGLNNKCVSRGLRPQNFCSLWPQSLCLSKMTNQPEDVEPLIVGALDVLDVDGQKQRFNSKNAHVHWAIP